MNLFLRKLKQIVILLAITLFWFSSSNVARAETNYNPWHTIEIPTESTFADLAFTDNLDRGWLVGTKGALFETTDGGNTWQERKLDLGDEKISFTAISFTGKEGWITGRPSILLHTLDGGQSWSRIPLSSKLPGAPYGIVALGPESAEMVTDLGAIYQTDNGGKNWKALVEGSVGVARNISRSPNGEYIAVSARGNFYSTWKPGDSEWTPHNRNSSRRLQQMGFGADGRYWLLTHGGQVQFSNPQDLKNWEKAQTPGSSNSLGLLDLVYRTPEEIWLAGGSGNLLYSFDGGKTWEKDRDIDRVPSNLYKIVFVTPEQGFVLGQNGILLKYDPQAKTA